MNRCNVNIARDLDILSLTTGKRQFEKANASKVDYVKFSFKAQIPSLTVIIFGS